MANPPRPSGWLAELFLSGELARVAKESTSQNDMCRRLGVTKDAYISARIRLLCSGVHVPKFEEMRHSLFANSESATIAQDSTQPNEGICHRCQRRPSKSNGCPDTCSGWVMPESSGNLSAVFGEPGITAKRWPSVEQFDAEEPAVDVVPSGHTIKGVSSLLGPNGEIKAQWVKTTAQNDERQAWLDAIRSVADNLPRLPPTDAPAYVDEDLLAVYPVGDPHIGMLGWHEDAGENFDMEIAERNLVGAFQHLTALAPNAAEALLIFIGDNTHADGQQNTTTRGTRVDVDGRMVKMARTAIRAGRRAVDLALAKHKRVRLIWERGNHDELISAMTALAFSLIYENDPRVSVDTSPEMFHWFRFGANLIGTHHGDKVKTGDLLGVMAVDRADDWSATKHRRFYCGHYHHQIVKELPGLIVEYLPTLASSDAWHRSMGYRSQRAMYMDVLHKEHGHINRHIVGIGQLRKSA